MTKYYRVLNFLSVPGNKDDTVSFDGETRYASVSFNSWYILEMLVTIGLVGIGETHVSGMVYVSFPYFGHYESWDYHPHDLEEITKEEYEQCVGRFYERQLKK